MSLFTSSRSFTDRRVRSLALALAPLVLLATGASATMSTTFQISGNVGYELVGFGQPSGPGANGSVTLTTLPPGAQIMHAMLYSNDFQPGGGWLNATVTNPLAQVVPLGINTPPSSSDPVPISVVFGYAFPAIAAITTNGIYSIQLSPPLIGGNANQISGAGLLVIYQDPSLALSTITVNDGVQLLGGTITSQTTNFAQMPAAIGAGAGKLSLLTFADDAFSTNELIKFNGQTIGGPIDGNLNPNASVFNFNVTTVAGSGNQAELTSTGDIYGWHAAVLQSPVPEPGTAWLVGAGLAGMAWWRRRGVGGLRSA